MSLVNHLDYLFVVLAISAIWSRRLSDSKQGVVVGQDRAMNVYLSLIFNQQKSLLTGTTQQVLVSYKNWYWKLD